VSFNDRLQENETIQNIYLKTDSGIFDILSSVPGVGDFNELKKNAVKVPR
jgi:hypothetical protein